MGSPPFGIGLRRLEGSAASLPFEAHAFHWDWLPPDTQLHVARRDAASSEPLFLVVPDSIAYRGHNLSVPSEMKSHPLGIKRLTALRVTSPSPETSATARLLSANTIVRVESGPASGLELTFDGGAQGQVINVRPALPLVIRY
jgi:hypothetical protein